MDVVGTTSSIVVDPLLALGKIAKACPSTPIYLMLVLHSRITVSSLFTCCFLIFRRDVNCGFTFERCFLTIASLISLENLILIKFLRIRAYIGSKPDVHLTCNRSNVTPLAHNLHSNICPLITSWTYFIFNKNTSISPQFESIQILDNVTFLESSLKRILRIASNNLQLLICIMERKHKGYALLK
ncbi:hypothetical protein JHK85_000987 [Glycine max]|nr:hypothetical protein JHK85_000987 [Glycine max]